MVLLFANVGVFLPFRQKVEVFTRTAEPVGGTAKLNVLLLHGQAFTSKNWLDLGTLGLIAAMGHKAVAVDLPGTPVAVLILCGLHTCILSESN